jgi:hypothetical protein
VPDLYFTRAVYFAQAFAEAWADDRDIGTVLEQCYHLAQCYLPAADHDAFPAAETEKDRIILIHW